MRWQEGVCEGSYESDKDGTEEGGEHIEGRLFLGRA